MIFFVGIIAVFAFHELERYLFFRCVLYSNREYKNYKAKTNYVQRLLLMESNKVSIARKVVNYIFLTSNILFCLINTVFLLKSLSEYSWLLFRISAIFWSPYIIYVVFFNHNKK